MRPPWWKRKERAYTPTDRTTHPLHVERLEDRSLPAAFTPGDLVLYRVGDGSAGLTTTGDPVFLDEYTQGGTLVQSIPMPTAASGANHPVFATGQATSEGLLSRSPDGRYLMLTGYANTSASTLPTSTAATINRVVGRVDANATIDTSTALTDFADGNSPRGATTTDGTDIWVTGGSGGVRYTTLGATTSTQLSTTVTNLRAVNVVNGQLYVSDNSGTSVRLGAVGTGAPTTAGQTIANLPGFPTTVSPYQFFFADLSGTVAGLDTLYAANDTTGTFPAGILKFSLVNGSWTSNGTVSATAVRGLTGVVGAGKVTLFGTTGGNTATGGGSLYSFTDLSGYNGAISGTATTIATAGANTAFRGLALAPENISLSPTSLPDATKGAAYSQSVSATGGLTPYTYSVSSGSLPDGLSLDTGTGAVSGTPTTAGVSNFSIMATDATGASGTLAYTVRTNGVSVGSITRDTGSPTNVGTVTWTVTFSQAVTGLGASNFTLTDLSNSITGEALTGVAVVAGTDNTKWSVTAKTGTTGDGTLRLVVANDTGASVPIDGLPFSDSSADYAIDRTPPAVATITRGSPPGGLTNAGTVQFTVTFTEPVTGVDAADFTITTAGITGAAVTGVTGSGASYTVTANTGSGDGTIRLDLADDDSIADLAGNPLGGTGSGNGNFSGGQSYTIDKTVPTVLSITRATTSPTAADSVQFLVVFSESVTGVGAADFALTTGVTGAGITAVSGNGDSYTVTVDTGTGDGLLRLDVVDDDSVADAAGNPLGGAGTGNGNFTAGQSYLIDRTAPGVVTVTRANPLGGVTTATTVQFAVSFSTSVAGVDPSDFTLTANGPTGASITSVNGSGDSYTVTADTGTGDGTLRLDVADDDSITDAAGNPLGGTGSGNGDFTAGEVYTIDRTPPTVIIGAPSVPLTNSGPVSFTLTYIDPHSTTVSLTTGDITVNKTGTANAGVVGITGSGTTRTVTLSGITGTGTLGISVAAGTASDAAGNTAPAAGPSTTITIDNTPPEVSFPALDPGSDTGTSTSDGITAANSLTFSGTAEPGAGVALLEGSTLLGSTTAGSEGSWTTSGVSLPEGAHSVYARATDAAGNTTASAAIAVTVDRTAPQVSGFAHTPAGPVVQNAPVTYTVTFNEDIDAGTVNAADFANAGTAAISIGSINETSPGVFEVMVTPTTFGTLQIRSLSANTIADIAGNALATDATDLAVVTVTDPTPPTVAGITRGGSSPTKAAAVTFVVTFSEAVTGVDASDFKLTTTGLAGPAITNVTESGDAYTVTVATGTGDGTIRLDLADDDSVHDVSGNPLAGAGTGNGDFTAGESYTIDKTAPAVVVGRAAGQATAANSQPIHFTAAFNEPVVGFGASSVGLSGSAGGLAGASVAVTNPTGDGKTYDIAVGELTGDGMVAVSIAAGVVTDPAGNPNTAGSGNGVTVMLDTVPPIMSMPFLIAASDTGTSSTDGITHDTTPTFAGTAESGATIELLEGSTVLGTTTGNGGLWAITTPALADGSHSVLIRASDAAGNTTDAGPVMVTVDTTAPVATVTRAPGQAATSTATGPTSSVVFTVAFSEPVVGFNAAGLVIAGTAGGSVGSVSGSGTSYTVTISGFGQPGTVSLDIDAGPADDLAGNPSLASTAGESIAVQFATQIQLAVSQAGESVNLLASVLSPAAAATPPTGDVVFTFAGQGGTTQRSGQLTGATVNITVDGLPAGGYTISASYAGGDGFLGSSASVSFAVTGSGTEPGTALVPVGQNSTGRYAAAAGIGVMVFNPDGSEAGALPPFTAAEAPGGVRVAVADMTGDGVPDLAAVTGPGSPAQIRVIDGKTGAVVFATPLFDGFTGGAFVAAGDMTGDGRADLVVTPDQGGGPRVTVFDGADGSVLANFFGIEDPSFRGGARAAVGDLTGDGVADLLVSAGFGGGPRVAGFDGTTVRPGARPTHLFSDFFVFENVLRNGVYLAVGDMDGDGYGDVIAGAGPGGGPRVLAINGHDLLASGTIAPLANFFAGGTELRGGVRVAAKDLDGDHRADVVTGSGDTGDLFAFLATDLGTSDPLAERAMQLPSAFGGVYVG